MLLLLMAMSLPVVAEELDSLYSLRGGTAGMNRKEVRVMLEALLAEEYVDSAQCLPGRTLAQQQLSVENGMAWWYYDNQHIDQSLKATLASLELASQTNQRDCVLDMLSHKGVCYFRLGDYEKAIAALEIFQREAEALGDPWHLSSVYNNLAAVYLAAATDANDYAELADKFIHMAIKAEKKVENSPALSVRYGLACEIAVRNQRPEEALEMARQALALDEACSDTVKMARRYSQMGDALQTLSRNEDAQAAYLQAYNLLKNEGNLGSLSITCRQLGSLCALQGDRKQALDYLREGYSYSRQSDYRYMTQRIMQEIYLFYKGHDDNEALRWLEMSSALKDSILNEQTADKLLDYQQRYEMTEKQALIERQQHKLQQQRAMQLVMVSIIGFLLAVAVGGYAFRTARRHKAGQEQAEQEAMELRSQLMSREQLMLYNIRETILGLLSNPDLSVPMLSNQMAMSQSSLSRQVKMAAGCTVQEYIQKIRMEKAVDLLQHSQATVTEIAQACGYEDASYFSRVFKQRFLKSPTQYRKESRMESGEVRVKS